MHVLPKQTVEEVYN